MGVAGATARSHDPNARPSRHHADQRRKRLFLVADRADVCINGLRQLARSRTNRVWAPAVPRSAGVDACSDIARHRLPAGGDLKSVTCSATRSRSECPTGFSAQRSTFSYNEGMAQTAKFEPLEKAERSDRTCPLVFLDTSVILGYIQGDASAIQLFSVEAAGRIRFAVNPIVLQELLLAADATGR